MGIWSRNETLRKMAVLILPAMLALAGCARGLAPVAPTASPVTVETPTLVPLALTIPPAATAPPLPTSSPPATVTRMPTAQPSSPTPEPTTAVEEATAPLVLLERAEPPVRDDARLAAAFLGARLDKPMPAATPPVWEVGVLDSFFVGNVDANTIEQITAELLHVSDRAYYWFDTADPTPIDRNLLTTEAAEFDVIYDQVAGYFAPENAAGDERVHVVHVSPLSLCAVTQETAELCRLAGYFSPRDLLPAAVNPRTNGREMFVMNMRQFGRSSYLDVLAHELRHMLEARYDLGDEDWAVEGSAMLAAELAGHEAAAQSRANLFLAQPDRQLNSWSDGDSLPHYGQGYLFSRYLFERLGVELYRELAVSPASGLRAIDRLAEQTGADWSAYSLWEDWLVAMVVDSEATAGGPFSWQGPPLERAATTPLDTYPVELADTVHQYAADYYRLAADSALFLTFAAEPEVDLLQVEAFGGDRVWYALRDNYANPQLTRTFDLRSVDSATLEYAVYADIEEGYDFAYVSASTDGGETWRPLAAAGMEGEAVIDDPSESALADRFYTGRSEVWVEEQIDLTPYAGQEVAVRFEYITDPILTYDGLALDNIAVPEIGFFDDAESEGGGWTADGFVRAPERLPQRWHLLLVTQGEAGPTVERLAVAADGRLAQALPLAPGEEAILIVAASAPRTLMPATYELLLTEEAGH